MKKIHIISLSAAIHATLVLAGTAQAQQAPAMQESFAVEEIVVTAQKREEKAQDVPIAVSAFTPEALRAQRIDSAADLQLGVPNMNYNRALFGADNFQIRGIGQHVISVAGDAGVGVHENNTPMATSRIADTDFYDVERVEVLRGPQGTLYGRNSTGGVVNILTAKPTHDFAAGITADVGNYDGRKLQGFVNLPMGDMFAARFAATGVNRNGYMTNSITGDDVDNRKIWSARGSVAFMPSNDFKMTLMWEHFDEDDNRAASGKTLCVKDVGPTSIGGVATTPITQALLSRGCLQSSLYDPAARSGSVNSAATLGGVLSVLAGFLPAGVYDVNGAGQPAGMRELAFDYTPTYKAQNDFGQLSIDWKVADQLKLTSLTGYSVDDVNIVIDTNSTSASVPFANTPFTPGGYAPQYQVGGSNYLQSMNLQDLHTRQVTEELRLQSSFDGPLNFNVGGIYIDLNRFNQTYVMVNSETSYAALSTYLNPTKPAVYIDQNQVPDTTGHNYYLSLNPYQLKAAAAFGELYWQALDKVKVTLGLRYTDDKKSNTSYPITLLAPGQGWPFVDSSGVTQSIVDQKVEFKETTGRLNVDWQVNDNSLLYASYSKGYKGGGFNSPDIVAGSATYKPEFVNAIEIGSKNEFFDRRVLLNLTAFSYAYQDYQISKISGFAAVTDNVDASISGLEVESVWEATEHLRFNANLGWLDTKIDAGSAIDPFNRTQGDPAYTLLKSTTSACIAETADVAGLLAVAKASGHPEYLLGACPSAAAPNGAFTGPANPFAAYGVDVPTTAGIAVNLKNHELPSSPHATASLGAQYKWNLGEWVMAVRGDFYYQSSSYATFFNTNDDKLDSWSNVNASLSFDRPASGLRIQVYGRNLADKDVITAAAVQSDAQGLFRTAQLLDPRLFGVSISKSF
jgi:outer membrane receptor protein involved in Fe transport